MEPRPKASKRMPTRPRGATPVGATGGGRVVSRRADEVQVGQIVGTPWREGEPQDAEQAAVDRVAGGAQIPRAEQAQREVQASSDPAHRADARKDSVAAAVTIRVGEVDGPGRFAAVELAEHAEELRSSAVAVVAAVQVAPCGEERYAQVPRCRAAGASSAPDRMRSCCRRSGSRPGRGRARGPP